MSRPIEPRIPPLDLASLTAEQRILAQIGASNVVRTLARYDLFSVLTLGEPLLSKGRLAPRERELAILRVALRTECAYEWANHVAGALGGGATADEIRALTDTSAVWPAADAALLRAVDELCADNCVTDRTWAELAATRDDAEIVELLFVVGFYRMMAGFLNSAGVQPEPGKPPLGVVRAAADAAPSRPPAPRRHAVTSAEGGPAGPAGAWQIVFHHPAGDQPLRLVMEVNGGTVSGALFNPALDMTVPIVEGTAEGDRFRFRAPVTVPFQAEIEFSGSVDGDTIVGDVTVRGAGTFPFDGGRA